ncbi:MAG: hypothetical protein Q8S53_13730 [Brevundimonas sp.]|uniref:hypothetical protein n=1 Tax=Brevundimonas sp. TaxID=1871086 RepID=UPI002736253E|nr:hypothetical protein [Brevundimonas sp.]MDP3379419.1 hypothetical protein [Brevundimonas sp.]
MLPIRDYARDADQLGFHPVGSYEHGQFTIDRDFRPLPAVYVWMIEADGAVEPVRVGQTRQLAARFSSYNGWLRGRRWPGERRNAREQEKARLTKLRLGAAARVVGLAAPDEDVRLTVESGLLQLRRPALDLNFELPDSWGRAPVRDWSAAYDAISRGSEYGRGADAVASANGP